MHDSNKKPESAVVGAPGSLRFVEMLVDEHGFGVEPVVYRLHLNDVMLEVPEDFDDEAVLRLLHVARAC